MTTTTSSTAPGGLAAHFVWCNRGKESVTLNTKSPAGMELLHRLLDRADAFVSNLAPGATARLGIAPADLAVRHPPQVIPPVEIDGYGPGGADIAQACLRPPGAGGVGLVRDHRLSRHARKNPGPRWPTSARVCTPPSRYWRCCSAAATGLPGLGLSGHRPSN